MCSLLSVDLKWSRSAITRLITGGAFSRRTSFPRGTSQHSRRLNIFTDKLQTDSTSSLRDISPIPQRAHGLVFCRLECRCLLAASTSTARQSKLPNRDIYTALDPRCHWICGWITAWARFYALAFGRMYEFWALCQDLDLIVNRTWPLAPPAQDFPSSILLRLATTDPDAGRFIRPRCHLRHTSHQ